MHRNRLIPLAVASCAAALFISTAVPAQEKTKLFTTLQIIDPGRISQYQNMMKGS